jgi:uncharacterized protein YjbJ (UPF0337 family)
MPGFEGPPEAAPRGEQRTGLAGYSCGKTKEITMDKDRIKGAANQAKGHMKEAAGKITGDAKLQAEGKADKLKGKIQNAAGGIKDSVRENKD